MNPSQREAVRCPGGPTLVFAGAGSGKTRVITHRIAWRIVEHGAPPNSILAVTFTNKAAKEMRTRVEQLSTAAGVGVPGLWLSTFHAFGLALLRRFGSDIGLSAGFPVFGADESRALVAKIAREIAREREIELEQRLLRRLAGQVSRLKNAEAGGSAFRRPEDPSFRGMGREVARRYQIELDRQSAVDLDDLQIRAFELLGASEKARSFVDRRVRHLLVDEYQDTSPIQLRLLRRLAPHRDVFAVGDDDQSIYSFRGADFRNMLSFRDDFPGARVFRLEDNYRSTAAILEASNALIRQNRRREGKQLRPTGAKGEPVHLRTYRAPAPEAQAAAFEIAREGSARGSTAVLVRTRAQTRAFEEAFVAHRIPHAVVGGLRFYERREVLDALAFVRLAMNERDDSAFLRALGAIPRGFGQQSRRRIEERAADAGLPLLAAARKMHGDGSFRGSIRSGLRGFLDGVARVERAVSQGPEAAVGSAIEDTGLGARLEADGRERLENLASLRTAAGEYERSNSGGAVSGFLDQVSLLSAEDLIPDSEGETAAPPVLVMTVHAAKGLEFDSVFLAGLWEGLFPHWLSLDSEAGIEEERRLFYVGMTRAKKRLLLSAAPGAVFFARDRDRGRPSRFLQEIPSQRLAAAPADAPALAGEPAAAAGAFRKGQRVRHPKLGVGFVESVDRDGERLSVNFRFHGRRRLVVRYAGLTPA